MASSNVQVSVQGYKEHNKSQGMMPPKKYNKLTGTDTKEMAIHELLDKDFKMIVLQKLSKL